MSDLMQFDDAAARHNAAYAAFTEMYKTRVPPPEMPAIERVDWITLFALMIMVVASVVVSGSRTVVEFGGGLVGGAAFVMLELGIVAYGYIRTKKHYDEARHSSVKRLTSAGMYLAFGVAIAANIHATLKQNSVPMPQALDVFILLMVAVAAPSLAFIAGDVLGMEAVAARRRTAQAEARHAEAVKVWREGLNAAWHASPLYKSVRAMVTSIQIERPQGNSTLSNGIPLESPLETATAAIPSVSTLGHTKKPMARKDVEAFFDANPEALEGNAIEIATLLGVGKSTVYTVMKERKQVNA